MTPRSSRQGASPATDDLSLGIMLRRAMRQLAIAQRFSALAQTGHGAGGIRWNGTLWNNAQPTARLLWLDVGRPGHLAPLLGFVGDELAEVGKREVVTANARSLPALTYSIDGPEVAK